MRRIAQVLAFFLLLVIGGNAFALTYAEAWQECIAHIATLPDKCTVSGCGVPNPTYTYKCEASTNGWQLHAKRLITPPGNDWNINRSWSFTGGITCPAGQEPKPGGGCWNPCAEVPDIPTHPGKEGWASCQTYTGPNGTVSCIASGVRAGPNSPFSGYVVWGSSGSKCNPPSFECPAQYIKRPDGTCEPVPECPEGIPRDAAGECIQPAECPLGMTKDASGTCVPEENLCPAGQIKGPDGSCVEDSNQCGVGKVKGADGTCKPDADGDGNPDEPGEGEEGEHKAEDSASCDQPPVCSGDEIMCLHAKQLWRIDCNTRKARQVQMDAYCKRPPVCNAVALGDTARNAGCDAVEEAALVLQWKNVCNTEAMVKLLQKGAEGGTGDGGDTGTHQRLDKL